MSDQLLVVLQICFLALVYLVFVRVVRAVWVELRAEQVTTAADPATRRSRRAERPPASAPARGRRRPVAGGLLIVAPPGLVGQAFPLDEETTIGRAGGCAVSIDDAHVSKLHARVYRGDAGWLIEDLGSTNGTEVDGHPITGPTALRVGSRIGLGDVVLELT